MKCLSFAFLLKASNEFHFLVCLEDGSLRLLQSFQNICYPTSYHVAFIQLALLWIQISRILLDDKRQLIALSTEGPLGVQLYTRRPRSYIATCR